MSLKVWAVESWQWSCRARMCSPVVLVTNSSLESAVVNSLYEAVDVPVVVPEFGGNPVHLVEPLRNRNSLFGSEFIDRALLRRMGDSSAISVAAVPLATVFCRWVLRVLHVRDPSGTPRCSILSSTGFRHRSNTSPLDEAALEKLLSRQRVWALISWPNW